MSTTTEEMFVGIILGALIWIIIAYNIISSASRSSKILDALNYQNKLTLKQLQLMVKLLEKNGVAKEEIEEAIKNNP